MTVKTANGWQMELDRGPDWLFVRLRGQEESKAEPQELAETVWSLLQQQFAHRLVVELDELAQLRTGMIGELVRLRKRIDSKGGMMRLSGVSDDNQKVLEINHLDNFFPQYRTRTDAVMGHTTNEPDAR